MGVDNKEALELLNKKKILLTEIFAMTDRFCQAYSENSEMSKFIDAYNLLYTQRTALFDELAEHQACLVKLDLDKSVTGEGIAALVAENDELIYKIIELDKEATEVGAKFSIELKTQIKAVNDSRNISMAYNANYPSGDGYLLDKKN